MKIKRFTAKNIHGYLNYDISFKDDITFLIGINGTGKTSVLKVILGLISPSYNYLNQIEFDEAILECYDLNEILIKATKEGNKIHIDLNLNGNKISGDLTKFSIDYNEIPLSRDEHRERLNFYKQQFEEEEIYSQIKKLATPLFLGIDRRVYEGQEIDRNRTSFLLRKKNSLLSINDPLNISLTEVQGLLYDYYRIIASQQPGINEKFKNKILAQTFEFIDFNDNDFISENNNLKSKRTETLNAIDNLKVADLRENINSFFDKMENVLNELRKSEFNSKDNNSKEPLTKEKIEIIQKWFTNQPQLKRINEIIQYSQNYQTEIDELYRPVNKLKNLINHFFTESRKSIEIDDKGDILIHLSNGKYVEPYQLSSGEKQILSMLAHLVFFQLRYEKEGGIFIIDEPELSLHLAWQEIFVKSLIEASPETQFILATHSPSILAEYGDEFCEDLIKLN